MRVTLDAPALGVLRVRIDAGELQRSGIGPARVSVDILEIGRPVAGDLVEHLLRRVQIDRHTPAAAAQPRTFRQGRQHRLDRSAQTRLVGDIGEADVLGGRRAPDQMVVRILEAGKHQRFGRQVVDLRTVEEGLHLVGRTDRCDLAVDHCDSSSLGLGRVHGEHAGTAEDQRVGKGG